MIYQVDADTMCYLAALATEGLSEAAAAEEMHRYVEGLSVDLNCNLADMNWLLTGDTNFRYAVYPGYKHARRDKPKPTHLAYCKEVLTSAYGAFTKDGLEADDLAAIYHTMLLEDGEETCIVSIDKDLNQLYGNHYNPRTKERYILSPNQAEYFFWNQMLVGDVADSIPGVPGIGPKKAEKLLSFGTNKEEWQEIVRNAYDNDEMFLMYGKCLWLKRHWEDEWNPLKEGDEATVS